MFDLQAFLIGGGIGLSSAILGALVEYRVVSHRQESEQRRLPGCMFLVSGALGFLGVIAIAITLLTSGEMARTLIAGVGVGVGFFVGFVLMILAWIFWSRLTES